MSDDWDDLLHEAFEIEDVEVFEECLRKGADINSAVGCNRSRLLGEAIGRGIQAVDHLPARGADPNLPVDYTGCLPLTAAVLWGDSSRLEMVQRLLAAGAEVKFEEGQGTSPVHAAAERDDAEVLRLLLESGGTALLDQLDYVGRTPLMCAVDEDSSSAAAVISSGGVDLDSLDNSYVPRTALGLAIENKNYDMAAQLLAAGAEPDEGSFSIAKRMTRSPEFLELLSRYRRR